MENKTNGQGLKVGDTVFMHPGCARSNEGRLRHRNTTPNNAPFTIVSIHLTGAYDFTADDGYGYFFAEVDRIGSGSTPGFKMSKRNLTWESYVF